VKNQHKRTLDITRSGVAIQTVGRVVWRAWLYKLRELCTQQPTRTRPRRAWLHVHVRYTKRWWQSASNSTVAAKSDGRASDDVHVAFTPILLAFSRYDEPVDWEWRRVALVQRCQKALEWPWFIWGGMSMLPRSSLLLWTLLAQLPKVYLVCVFVLASSATRSVRVSTCTWKHWSFGSNKQTREQTTLQSHHTSWKEQLREHFLLLVWNEVLNGCYIHHCRFLKF
jgi:hypothetical protein